MARPKKNPILEENKEIDILEPVIYKVMDKDNNIIKIDINKEPDWAKKYRHFTGVPFTI